ncbi:MAG: oligosaccharide flippase family protein [Candidatus Eisenbacteria bacterium]|uniref:Oligosaccharide flippase family protein n=1 Tax=Eiseniibacteriota bacterium TaxID=2212470 RepID=A0A937X763_UNCEI|nr:oligosaccharide flippase family protein [Candidatus Eisenbacteria bacterium]
MRAGAIVREAVASTFARHTAMLVSGTAVGYILTALASPLLGRLYSPADFGLLALFASLVGILGEAATARYELAIVLPERDEEAANLVALTAGVVVAASLAALALVALAGGAFARLLGSPELTPFLWWVPPVLLALGLDAALSHWMTRRRAFLRLSAMQIGRSAGTALTQVGAGLARAGSAGLVAGRVVGEACGFAGLALQLRPADRELFRRSIRLPEILRLARAYSDFPRFSMPQGLLNAVSQSLPPFLLAAFYDTSVAGLYAMGHRLLYLPARFIGQAVRQVYLQRASETRARGGDLHRLFTRATLGLAALGALPALAMVLWGPDLFRLALGPQWGEAGVYARWMTLWLYFAFVNPPAMVLMQVLRLQHLLLAYDATLLVARCAAFVLGGMLLSPLATIALFSLIGALFNAALPAALWWHTRRTRPSPEAPR